jgi:AraC-like DNA-binding protein
MSSPGAGAPAGPSGGSFHVVVSGACWLRGSAADRPLCLRQGDVVVVPRGDAFTIAGTPGGDAPMPTHLRDPSPAGRCRFLTHAGTELAQLVCGCIRVLRDDPLVAMLPRFVHVPACDTHRIGGLRSTMTLLGEEAAAPGIGSEAVVHRLMELLLIHVFRTVAPPVNANVDVLAALRVHKQLGVTLRAMQAHPEHPWTIDLLARQAACSRTAFLARFAHLIGQPPLRYLTLLRMTRAKELLLTSTNGLDRISEAVGYNSVEGFTRAFKRNFGVTPAQLRGRHRSARRHGALAA